MLATPPKYSGTSYWVLAASLYALAKLFEASDHAVYANFILSGHTLKHLFAAAACFAVLRHFKVRPWLNRTCPNLRHCDRLLDLE
jgi:hypothetical protein